MSVKGWVGVRICPVFIIPRVRCGAINGGRIPWSGVSELDVWECGPFVVSKRPELEIWKSFMDVQWDAVAGWAGQTGLETGETFGCLLESTSEGFELTRGENSLTIRHAGSMMDNHNDGPLVGKDVGTGSDKLELSDDVVRDALEVDVDLLCGDDTHVRSGNGAVGPTVNQTSGSS